jgi:hypothetical protein
MMDGKIFRRISHHDLFGFTSLTSVVTAAKKKLLAKADNDTPRSGEDMQESSVDDGHEWFPLFFLILAIAALLISLEVALYLLVHGVNPDALPLQHVTEIVKTVGLVCAGGWTAWTFYRLQKIRAAELANNKTLIDIEKGRVDIEKTRGEIEKTRLDIEKTRVDVEKSCVDTEKSRNDIAKSRIEQEAIRETIRNQQPQLAIQLEVSESASPNPAYQSVLAITTVVKNEGNQHLWMSFDESSLTVGRLEFYKNGRQRLSSVIKSGPMRFTPGSRTLRPFDFRILRVGQTRRMALALVPITTPGSYLIQFRASYERAQLMASDSEDEKICRDNLAVEAIEQSFYIATAKAAGLAPTPAVQSQTGRVVGDEG